MLSLSFSLSVLLLFFLSLCYHSYTQRWEEANGHTCLSHAQPAPSKLRQVLGNQPRAKQRERDRQRDRQTDREAETHTDRGRVIRIDTQPDVQICLIYTETLIYK